MSDDAGPGPDVPAEEGPRSADGEAPPGDGDDPTGGSTGGTGPVDGSTDAGDPFESLPDVDVEDPFERLDDGAGPGERTPVGDADPFEEVDVGTAGEDASWEELLPTEPTDGTGIDPTTVGETVVPKRRYCQGCEHFTAPPAVACTHTHGEIVEVVDVDHFRVRNCPVVAHRRERPVYDDEPGIEGDED